MYFSLFLQLTCIKVLILHPHTKILKKNPKNYKCHINHDFLSHIISVFCFIFLLKTVISSRFQSFIKLFLSAYYLSEIMLRNRNSNMIKKQSLHLRNSHIDMRIGIFKLITRLSCRWLKAWGTREEFQKTLGFREGQDTSHGFAKPLFGR